MLSNTIMGMRMVHLEDEPLIMDYKHCFLIKYPYKRIEQQLIADQMFTLLIRDVEEENEQEDPFEFEQADKAPFLGIILVTIGTKLENTDNVKYSSLLEAYKNVCLDILSEEMEESIGCYKVFYTPNCADLCIVIRTNMIKNIYNVKKKLSVKTIEGYSSGICYTISYTMFQLSNQQWSDEIVEVNKALKIELRLSEKEAAMQSISEYCRNCDSCNV